MSDTSSEERDIVEIGKALIDYYEKYAKNDDLVDSFIGLDLEQRNQLRTKRSEGKCSSTAASNERIEIVEIHAKQFANEIEIEVFENENSPGNAGCCGDTLTEIDPHAKPLEWDSGADIGYNQKYKSFSMPSLEAVTTAPKTARPSTGHEPKCYFDYFNRPTSHRSETANQIGRKLAELINERRAASAASTTKIDRAVQPEPEHVSVAVQTNRSELIQKKLEQKAYGEEVKLYLDLIHELMKKCDRHTKKQLVNYLRESIDKWYSRKDSSATTTTTTASASNESCHSDKATKKSTTIYKLVTENCYSHEPKDRKPMHSNHTVPSQPRSGNCCCRRKKVELKTQPESRHKPPIAYTMTFPAEPKPTNVPQAAAAATYDLQEYLIKNRPDFVTRTEQRRQQLFELQTLREHRKQLQVRDGGRWLIRSDYANDFKENHDGFRTREIRLQARNNYNRFDDAVRKKRESEHRSQAKQTYRLMSQVFRKNLQNQVLKGNTNLSNNMNLIA